MSANTRVKLQHHDHTRFIERNPTLRLKHSTLANKKCLLHPTYIFLNFFPLQISTKSKTVGEDNPLPLESSTALTHKPPSVLSGFLAFIFGLFWEVWVSCLKPNQNIPNGFPPAQKVLSTPLVSSLSYADISI